MLSFTSKNCLYIVCTMSILIFYDLRSRWWHINTLIYNQDDLDDLVMHFIYVFRLSRIHYNFIEEKIKWVESILAEKMECHKWFSHWIMIVHTVTNSTSIMASKVLLSNISCCCHLLMLEEIYHGWWAHLLTWLWYVHKIFTRFAKLNWQIRFCTFWNIIIIIWRINVYRILH